VADYKNGKHLRRLDHGLLSKHTLKLYGSRQRNRVYTPMQLRSGHSWLADHAKIRRFREDDKMQMRSKRDGGPRFSGLPKPSRTKTKATGQDRRGLQRHFNNAGGQTSGHTEKKGMVSQRRCSRRSAGLRANITKIPITTRGWVPRQGSQTEAQSQALTRHKIRA
jgi:hypothetical protein